MKSVVFILYLILYVYQVKAGELTKFRIFVETEKFNSPVSVPLDGINYNTDAGELVLYDITDGGMKVVPSQLEAGHSARLWFLLKGVTNANTSREFLLKSEIKGEDSHTDNIIDLRKHHNDMQLLYGDLPVFSYRFGTKYPPEGVNPLFKRSGFIHPLWSPGGEMLTRIQPPDHYHHYGIWGPWTKTHIDGREVDFWNLAKGEGTVEFAGFISKFAGDIFSGFQAHQKHMDFGGQGKDQVAMNEILDVRVWNTADQTWVIDYTTTLTSPLENGIMLDAYRYGGGIGFRATEIWHKDNCTVLTSEGKTRIDADGSFARWCIVEGESSTDEGRSGILFLSHPSNRMHPEPMRVWPLDANQNHGDMFFEFTPIRYEDWKIQPNQVYSLKYRMIVFDGAITPDEAERYWNSFAVSPAITYFD
jgi:hypothetical protein